jgi:transcriptional adapter 2-alpha
VIDSLKFPLFVNDWTAKEEKLLLEGVLKYGFGNWGCIAEYLGKTKPARECELHYRQIYLASAEVQPLSGRDDSGMVEQLPSAEAPPLPMDTEDLLWQEPRPEPAKHALMEFAGYMPLRRDFEVEYENEVEMYLADLEFYEDDQEDDKAIKCQQLHNYNKVLDEREERKAFAMDRWLQELATEKQFRGTVIQRNVYHAMKPYARFLAAEQHRSLCEAMVQDCILRMKLQELNEAKRQGIQTETEFRAFLLERRNLTSAKQEEYDAMMEDSSEEPQCSEEIQKLKESPVVLDSEVWLEEELPHELLPRETLLGDEE